jgi:hypothetical protein
MTKAGWFGIGRWRRFLWAGLAAAVAVGGGALVWASVPHAFQAQTTLHASDLNDNFTALDQRIATLEAQAHPPSAFHAWLSTAGPTLQTSTRVTISFDQVEFDLGSEYNPSTGIFSPKQAGTYLISCGAFFSASAAGVAYNASILSGTTELSGYDAQSSIANVTISCETTVMAKLAAGDKITCAVYVSGAPQTLTPALARRNRFSAARLY